MVPGNIAASHCRNIGIAGAQLWYHGGTACFRNIEP